MSADLEQDELGLDYNEQYRATRLQVHMWGTFSDTHDIPISTEGFLIIGPSGAGKSTLLDAISALLVPLRWVDFNAAAREQERRGKDRNLLSYVRGAWSQAQDELSGEFATRYLRSDSTWSGLALSFENGKGRTITLAQVIWIRGKSAQSKDIHRQFMIFERGFSLSELGAFDLDVRKLKKAFPDAIIEGEFGPYEERFMRLLGIESENALRLLHKTQSAKNLGDLNVFLRDYMLEEPETFDAAKGLVEEFAELDAAHKSVITERRQIAMLAPARDALERLAKLESEIGRVDVLLLGLGDWICERKRELYRDLIEGLLDQLAGAQARLSSARVEQELQEASLSDLERRYREEGGEALAAWEKERREVEKKRAKCNDEIEKLRRLCEGLELSFPASPEAFGSLVVAARKAVEEWQASGGKGGDEQARRDELKAKGKELASQRDGIDRDIVEMERQGSNIPAEFLRRRRDLAASCNVRESSLPFVGELLEVLPAESQWRPAVERVLRGFALSILVDEEDYPDLARVVDDAFLGYRLVYYRVGSEIRKSLAPSGTSLPAKLRIKEGRWKAWLEAELAKRFDYRCVQSPRAFADEERALTKAGQVKHGKSHHEKDDRRRIGDPTDWLLGFENREKREFFVAKSKALAIEVKENNQAIEAIERRSQAAARRIVAQTKIGTVEWEDIDSGSLVERSITLERLIAEAKGEGSPLAGLGSLVDRQRLLAAASKRTADEAYLSVRGIEKDSERAKSELEEIEDAARSIDVENAIGEEIAGIVSERSGKLSLRNIARAQTEATSDLHVRKERLISERDACSGIAIGAFKEFRRTWESEARDLDDSIESAPEYLAKLYRLEVDELPKHEGKFFELLRNQSHQHLTRLSTLMDRSRKAIRQKMEIVNESLAKAPFGEGTWLHIDVLDRPSPEVVEFRSRLRDILDNALSGDPAEAEDRFGLVRDLVSKLSKSEAEDERWRKAVLDVRNHVEFVARERDADGREVEVYKSGSGKSGGQRQKLATTCLAAALRYQLGGMRYGLPRFAMVVVDEAFDKADHEFTAMLMDIFRNFGFQMIMATPLKAIMSLEPYVGGACYVGIRDRKESGILSIAFNAETKRLVLPEAVQALEEDSEKA